MLAGSCGTDDLIAVQRVRRAQDHRIDVGFHQQRVGVSGERQSRVRGQIFLPPGQTSAAATKFRRELSDSVVVMIRPHQPSPTIPAFNMKVLSQRSTKAGIQLTARRAKCASLVSPS